MVNFQVGSVRMTDIAVTFEQKSKFIEDIVAANYVALQFNLPPSIMIAQACLESGFGQNPRAKEHFTLFGITKREALSLGKERDWYPSCNSIVLSPTEVEREVVENGVKRKKLIKVYDRFCNDITYQGAVTIWAEYVTRHPHADKKLFTRPPWSEGHLILIGNYMSRIGFGSKLLGNYAHKLLTIIKTHDLTQYDPPHNGQEYLY
jgi:hypothetical protein